MSATGTPKISNFLNEFSSSKASSTLIIYISTGLDSMETYSSTIIDGIILFFWSECYDEVANFGTCQRGLFIPNLCLSSSDKLVGVLSRGLVSVYERNFKFKFEDALSWWSWFSEVLVSGGCLMAFIIFIDWALGEAGLSFVWSWFLFSWAFEAQFLSDCFKIGDFFSSSATRSLLAKILGIYLWGWYGALPIL